MFHSRFGLVFTDALLGQLSSSTWPFQWLWTLLSQGHTRGRTLSSQAATGQGFFALQENKSTVFAFRVNKGPVPLPELKTYRGRASFFFRQLIDKEAHWNWYRCVINVLDGLQPSCNLEQEEADLENEWMDGCLILKRMTESASAFPSVLISSGF